MSCRLPASKSTNFEHPAHDRGNVSYVGCHPIHAPGAAKHLLKIEQPQLCFHCHNEVKPEFSMPFHHRVEEGVAALLTRHQSILIPLPFPKQHAANHRSRLTSRSATRVCQ
ncbi:MAG: cytochrome c3 family protein [Terracidiphilus sp.]